MPGGATFLTVTNIGAAALVDFMQSADQGAWNGRFIGRPSLVTYAINATATGCLLDIYSGDRAVMRGAAVPAGGTAGVPPAIDQFGRNFLAAQGEVLEFRVRGDSSGTTDLNLTISVDPVA